MQLRLNRSVPVLPAPTLPDMERDRRIKSIASLSRVPLLRDLERCIATLAGQRPAAIFASCWKGSWPWRRYPPLWRTLLTAAWGHPAPEGGAFGPQRDPDRNISPSNSAAGHRREKFRER